MANIPPNFEQLIKACTEGNISLVLELLPTTDANWFKSAPLRTAAQHNHTDIVLALLPHSNPCANDNQALRFAIQHRNDVMFDALFPLCPDPLSEEFYSIYAILHTSWPEKLTLFDTPIPQHQYDMAFLKMCRGTTDLNGITALLDKTSVDAQKSAMTILLEERKYELFDMLVEHNDPQHCVEAMVACLPHDYHRGAKLFQRLIDANVTLPNKAARNVLIHALRRLDWTMIAQAAPLNNYPDGAIIEEVVKHNDVDVYNYFEQLGATPTSTSAEHSAEMGNKELTMRQLNAHTVTPKMVHWICAWGWQDVLSTALMCISENHIHDLQHSSTTMVSDFDENALFASCVRHGHYACLGQVLSHVFVKHKRSFRMGRWVNALAGQFYSDPVFVNTLSKNVSQNEIDQILDHAQQMVCMYEKNRKDRINVIEHFLPFASQKQRKELFHQFVCRCTQSPDLEYAHTGAHHVAPYMTNTDIKEEAQSWWDTYTAEKLNTTLTQEVGMSGVDRLPKKM